MREAGRLGIRTERASRTVGKVELWWNRDGGGSDIRVRACGNRESAGREIAGAVIRL